MKSGIGGRRRCSTRGGGGFLAETEAAIMFKLDQLVRQRLGDVDQGLRHALVGVLAAVEMRLYAGALFLKWVLEGVRHVLHVLSWLLHETGCSFGFKDTTASSGSSTPSICDSGMMR